MKEKLKKYGVFLIPGLISVTLVLIIFAIKGIYPFGKMTIVHADLGQIFINNYHYLYDSVREGKISNLLFTNLLYGGSNIWGTEVVSGFFSPFSLLIFLCGQRENLVYFFSYILLIKLMCISITTYWFFNKVYKDSRLIWKILFSTMYTLSGYVILNYTTIIWLDLVCIFPLLIYSLKRIFDKCKYGWYTILLALCFIISYQLTYMTIFMIMAIMPFVLKYYVQKERRKEVVTALGIGTVTALLIPCVFFLPAIEIYLNSFRTTIELNYAKYNMDTLSTKVSYLFFSALPLYGLFKARKYIKKDKIVKMLYLCFLVVGVIPILSDEVNKLWHGGSYDSFPFRYGYMPIFILFNIAMYYMTKYFDIDNYKERIKNNKKTFFIKVKYVASILLEVIGSVGLIVACIYVAYNFSKSLPAFKTETKILVGMIIISIIILIYIMYLVKTKNKYLYRIITTLTIMQIFVFLYGCIGMQEKYRGGSDHSDHSIIMANTIIKDMPKIESGMYKYKDADGILLENTALVTKLPSISSWLLTTENQVNSHKMLGYSKYDFKIDSIGGTIFSDALMNVKYVLTKDFYSSSAYTKIGSLDSNKVNLYELKKVLPVGIVFNRNEDIFGYSSNKTDFENQNYLYQKLFDKTDNILEILKAEDIVQDKEIKQITKNADGTLLIDMTKKDKLEFNIPVEGEKELYLNVEKIKDKTFWITINGKLISIRNPNEYIKILHGYPNNLNNGILKLGTYRDEIVNIELISTGKTTCSNIEFGLLDIEKYLNICDNATKTDVQNNENGSDINIVVDAKENQEMFLPIAYDKNWKYYVNGKEKSVERIFTGFIGLELEEGQNKIELKYTNNMFKYGMIISLIGILLFIFTIIIDKDGKLTKNKLIKNVLFIGFIIICILFYFAIYGYGIAKSIWNCILFIKNMC